MPDNETKVSDNECEKFLEKLEKSNGTMYKFAYYSSEIEESINNGWSLYKGPVVNTKGSIYQALIKECKKKIYDD